MKNNYIKYSLYNITLLVLITLCNSCKKLIEIPSNAPGDLVTALVFKDSATAQAAITGIYSSFSIGTDPKFTTGAITAYTGVSSDEIEYSGTDVSFLNLYNSALLSTNPLVSSLWSGGYNQSCLYQINSSIEGLQASNTLSTMLRNQLLGETKFLRAFFYFQLVNLFGAVPLVTGTDYRTNAVMARSDTAAVYTQIVNDLKDAQTLLTTNYPSAGRVRPNYYTATALLARVQLYIQQWSVAEAAATEIISDGRYTLATEPNLVFLRGSSEAIWQLPPGAGLFGDKRTSEGYAFVPTSIYVTLRYPVSNNLRLAFAANDLRGRNWIGTFTHWTGQISYYPFKYKINDNSSLPAEDYMMLRLGEQYLVRAEARARQYNLDGALEDLNKIRRRAGLADTSTATQAAALGAILKERQLELCFEWGHRWYDLKRTGTIDAALSTLKPGWKPTAALYPVPFGELQKNPFLTQNAGY